METKDRSPILIIIGIPLLLIGIVAAFMGPLEIYCFYLFSEGGPFYYEGFGFGSFMFGNITTQIIGYYVIALILIPLGYGHLRVRRWIRPVSLALLRCWLVLGVPLAVIFLLVLVTAKELTLAGMRFPPTEMEAFQNLPLEGTLLVAFFGLPLLLTTTVVALSRRHFGNPHPEAYGLVLPLEPLWQ